MGLWIPRIVKSREEIQKMIDGDVGPDEVLITGYKVCKTPLVGRFVTRYRVWRNLRLMKKLNPGKELKWSSR